MTTTHRCDAARFTRLQADAFATHLHQLSGDSTAAADTPLSVRRLLLEVRLLSYSPTPLLPYSASAVTLSQQLMLRDVRAARLLTTARSPAPPLQSPLQ